MEAPLPADIAHPANAGVLEFVAGLSAHSDIVEKLTQAIEALDDVAVYCPDPARYRYVVAYTRKRIFAFVCGMSSVYVRLAPQDHALAVAAGAGAAPVPDNSWVCFRLWQAGRTEPEFARYVALAWQHARAHKVV